MEYKTTELGTFHIVGISVRTTNENGQAGKDIQALWEKFFREGVAQKVTNKESELVYNMYIDYESDQNGAYTTIVGYKVKNIDNIPEGLTVKTIPTSQYQVYTSKGKLPDSVIKTWEYIWESKIDRRYLADFDVYDLQAQDENNSEVLTYLSVES